MRADFHRDHEVKAAALVREAVARKEELEEAHKTVKAALTDKEETILLEEHKTA